MKRRIKAPKLWRFWRRTEGVAAVEFALMATVFLLLMAGIIDFGHAFYMRQVVCNASQEGVRYGVSFWKVDGNAARVAPNAMNPTIQNYVLNTVLANTSVTGATVNVSGAGYTVITGGLPLVVTVTAPKTWFLLGGFIPGLPTTISSTSTMNTEGF